MRYVCKECKHWFRRDHRVKNNHILRDHIDGTSLRNIARHSSTSKSALGRTYLKELKRLANNNDITYQYCTRFCGILVLDGKYTRVKGYEKKIPLLWGIDYFTHDLPIFTLARSESYEAWLKYFGLLKSAKYPLSLVVCDDNENIARAARYMFPNVRIQICQVHFLENIRRALNSRTEEKYRPFVTDLANVLFSKKITRPDFEKKAFKIFKRYELDVLLKQYMLKIDSYAGLLTAASEYVGAPRDTNLIELYNSHLEGRLKSIKGFESFHTAKLWLNAYVLRRRYKVFTDCSTKFRYLNGTNSISHTKKRNGFLPALFL